MKKIIAAVLFALLASASLFAEKIVFRTGELLALSPADYFFPVDVSVTGSRCSVTSVKNVEGNLWCISIAAWKSGASAPTTYDYYVKTGDSIKLRRASDPMNECTLTVTSITWNEAELNIE